MMRRSTLIVAAIGLLVGPEALAQPRFHIPSAAPLYECDQHEVLYPGVYKQLAPFMGGINQTHIEGAADILRDLMEWFYVEPVPSFQSYDKDALELPPSHAKFPWSSNMLVKLVLIDGVFYLPSGHIPIDLSNGGFTSMSHRCYVFALDELVRLADMFKLPDMVLIVGSDDDPLVEGPSANGLIPPIFKTSSSKAAYDLILPDCYPDHSPGEFDTIWTSQFAKGETVPWEQKLDKAIGRYNLMCPPYEPTNRKGDDLGCGRCARIEVHKLTESMRNAEAGLLDAGLYQFAHHINSSSLAFMSMQDQLKYKYTLNLDGRSIASRLPYLLASDQVVIKETNSQYEHFFSAAIHPWKDYVPIGDDNFDEIFDRLQWLNNHPETARKIANSSAEFARKHLTEGGRLCYVKTLLEAYADLLTFSPGKLSDYPYAVPLSEALDRAHNETLRMHQHLQDTAHKRRNYA